MFWTLNSFAFRIQLISWTLFLWGLAKIKKLGGNTASSIWSKTVSPSLAASESSIKCLWIQTFYCHLAAMVVVLGLMYCFIECSFPGWGSFLMQVGSVLCWVPTPDSDGLQDAYSLHLLLCVCYHGPPKLHLINPEVCWALSFFPCTMSRVGKQKGSRAHSVVSWLLGWWTFTTDI